jgi:pseudouridine-5'-phosphate glycosidase
MPDSLIKSSEIGRALRMQMPIVALESAVITHGLPKPQNLQLARDMEEQIRRQGAVPATVAVLDGNIHVGLTDAELEMLAQASAPLKISRRDFATAITKKANGGTTVAGTMFAAERAGIKVFATGGIGGVHREARFDVSTDLQALADTQMIVVCAGAKSILDLPATLEYLETVAVPVVGYQTEEFPAFFSRESGLKTSLRLDSAQEIAEFARTHWGLGMKSAILITQPVPKDDEIPTSEMDPWLRQASATALEKKIHGQALTPFLLETIKDLSGGKSLRANLALLLNNARLAAQIAKILTAGQRQKLI